MSVRPEFVAPDGEIFDSRLNVLEVRGCANGFVITVWHSTHNDDSRPGRGYFTRVVESLEPAKVGAAVTEVLEAMKLQPGVYIPAARKLP